MRRRLCECACFFVDFGSYQVSLELPVASLLMMVVGFMQSKSKLSK
jgi:hypothetical protein